MVLTMASGIASAFTMKAKDSRLARILGGHPADERSLFATFEMIALETWRDQNQKSYL
jgi:hypothetical protein